MKTYKNASFVILGVALLFQTACTSLKDAVGDGLTSLVAVKGSKDDEIILVLEGDSPYKYNRKGELESTEKGGGFGTVVAIAAAEFVASEVIAGVGEVPKNFVQSYSTGRRIAGTTFSDFYIYRNPIGFTQTKGESHGIKSYDSKIHCKLIQHGQFFTLEVFMIDVKRPKAAVHFGDDDIDVAITFSLKGPNDKTPNHSFLSMDAPVVVKGVKINGEPKSSGSEHVALASSDYFTGPGFAHLQVKVIETADFHKLAERGVSALEGKEDDLESALKSALGVE